MAGRTAIQSFDWRTLQIVQKEAPEIPTVYLTVEKGFMDSIQAGQAVIALDRGFSCQPLRRLDPAHGEGRGRRGVVAVLRRDDAQPGEGSAGRWG